MTKLKIIFFALIITLNSCKNQTLITDTEAYKIEIKKASIFHRDFTNHIQKTPLNIHAERINLKDILGILIKTDTSNIKLKNKELKNDYFNILIQQKNKTDSIHELVLDKILKSWNLKVTIKKHKSYQIRIQDSLKFSDFKNNSTKLMSVVSISNDSIKIKNCDLKKLSDVLNSKFSEESVFDSKSEKINYSWKRAAFDTLKVQLQNDLGILFTDIKKDKSVFTIRKN